MRLTATMFASLCFACAANAQNPPIMIGPNGQMEPNAPGGPAMIDETFASKAARAGLAEMAEARLALKKAQRQEVKDIAQQMLDDHGKANQKLMEIAAQENVILPKAPDAKEKQQESRLQSKSGHEFDAAYLKAQAAAHRDAIALFQKEAQAGHPPFQNFAEETLPILQSHAKMIEDAMESRQGMVQ